MAEIPAVQVVGSVETKDSSHVTTTSSDPDDQPTIVAATKSLELEASPLSTLKAPSPKSTSTSTSISTPGTIEDLPNELLSNIFGYLDIPQPSAADSVLLDEPKFEVTHSNVVDLKSSSRVSKRWRQAILPVLFRYARFIVAQPALTEPTPILDDEIKPFLEFTKEKSLAKVITSFVLLVQDRNLATNKHQGERLDIFASFWHTLLQTINPSELLIVAHAQVLGALTSCHVYLPDVWNFDCPHHYLRLKCASTLPIESFVTEDAVLPNEYTTTGEVHQVVEPITSTFSITNVPEDLLKHDSASETVDNISETEQLPVDDRPETPERGADLFPHESPEPPELEPWQIRHVEASTLFKIRPWSSLLLNEGSFIKAYSTYEFWLRQAPSILSDLVGADDQPAGALISPTIREMSYIGIFPMASHFSSLSRHLPRLDSLYVQLVPRNDILQNRKKTTQVETNDLWMERNSCYALMMRELFNAPPVDNYKYLQVFESGDAADTDAWNMAVEYVKRAGNGWKVAGEGVFVRDPKDLAPEPEEGAEGEDSSSFQGALIKWAWNGITKLPVSAYPLYDRPLGPLN